jgi:hypothetical protein
MTVKSQKKNARKHTFAHKAGKPRSLNTPSFTGVEYQYDQPNGAKFKMKTAVSWVVAPCSQGDHRPDDGGSKYL